MSAGKTITVMIVDDHPVVREGLVAILSGESDIEVIGEAGTGEEAIEKIPELRPSVVLMDLSLPGARQGGDVIREIAPGSSEIHFIVLTSVAGDDEIYRAIEAGARGCLFKDMAGKELVRAVREVHGGGRHIPQEVGKCLAASLQQRHGLTEREIEVLQHVAAGLRNKQIAHKMALSEFTVKAHVKRVLEKLQVADRTHAVTIALKRGIIRLER
jgi:DNA-binding NarL/FixJ family response regulator